MASTGSDDRKMEKAAGGEKRGGWVTMPFILGNMSGMSVAIFGVTSNFMVYLIKQFNVGGVDAAQINNVVNGCINLAPIAGAILSDSFLGCFGVVAASSFLSLLGMVLFTLTATVGSLRPLPCSPGANECESPSVGQSAVLYIAVALGCAGAGGTRFNLATMGANQFDASQDQNVFFNWYFFVMYLAGIFSSTAIVYVQDNVSWGWGFGMCAAANAAGLALLFLGAGYYRGTSRKGSPYVALARTLVAAARKWKVSASEEATDPPEYYCGGSGGTKRKLPTGSFRFLNRAALKTPGDASADGSVARPWRLCTVDQVEDLKAVVQILPLWCSSVFLSVSIGIVNSLAILQALSLDRRLAPRFALPAGTLIVVTLLAAAVTLPALDRFFYPAWRRLTGRPLTPLQRLGVGHLVNTAAMAAAALVERRRLAAARSLNGLQHLPGARVPMSVLWLFPPMAAIGLGESFHFPGQVALYYQEFPETLRSSATGLIGLVIAVGFYLSTAVMDLIRRVTNWLPPDINAGRLDKVYWVLTAAGLINFGYYLICACSYRYHHAAELKPDSGSREGEPSLAMAAGANAHVSGE